jgi:DNA-binding GntR family transcriptional regulator
MTQAPFSATTADAIAAALREEIASGSAAPGARLRQEEIAARFGVSRIPVREALRRLESEGLLQVKAHRGARVTTLSGADVTEIFHLRAMLEGDLALAACAAMDEAARAEVAALGEASILAASTRRWSEADLAFHFGLYAHAGRPRQMAMAQALRREIARYERLQDALPELRDLWIADHRAIIDAVTRGDAGGASDATQTHVRRAGAFLAERMAQES